MTALRQIRPLQSDHFRDLFQPHMDPNHQKKFVALMGLIKSSGDGTITRGQLNAALYPGSARDSIKAQLSALKKALEYAAGEIGHQLKLVTPSGRGSDNQAVYLETDAPWQMPAPPSTNAITSFMARERYKNVPAQGVDLSQNLVFVSYFGEEQELVEALINRVEKTLQGKAGEKVRRIRFWLFRRNNGDNGIAAGENDHETIQRAIMQAKVGILMLSPQACGRGYIHNNEWLHFRDQEGNILKPFLPVMLSNVDENKDNLGVLGCIDGNRPQCVYLREQQRQYAWDKCVNNPGLEAQFVDQLIHELCKKLFEPQDVSLPLQKDPKHVRPLPPLNADFEEIKRKNITALAHEKTLK